MCSEEVAEGGGWQGKASSPLLQGRPGQQNSPTHPGEAAVVQHVRWRAVLGPAAQP